jgi:PKD repeat protein
MEATPRYGQPPLLVQFSSEGTLDPEGTALRYVWSFDDGETSDAADPSHTYTEAGNYKVLLTVTDGKDLATTATLNIGVGNEPPQAQILSPTGEARYRMGDTVEFQGRAMDAEDGVLTGAALQWEVFTHHNEHIHYDTFRGNGERGSFVYADHGDTVYLELCLIATDSADLQDRKCVDLYPQVITITLQSLPSGLPLLYDNTRYTTPFEVQTYINAVRSVEAPIAAGDLHFERWADSENAGRRITIPAEDLELTAIYMGAAGEGTTAEDKVPAAVVIANTDVEMSDDAQSVSAMPAELGIIHIAVAPSGGARILLETAGRFAGKWSAVQWQDATGTWQEIEGWQGQIENGRKRWWVAPDLYGNRFFRWVISDGEAGPVLAISKPFALPGSAEEMVVWQVE